MVIGGGELSNGSKLLNDGELSNVCKLSDDGKLPNGTDGQIVINFHWW